MLQTRGALPTRSHSVIEGTGPIQQLLAGNHRLTETAQCCMDADIVSRPSHNQPPQKGGHCQLAALAGSGRRKQLAERRMLSGAVADIVCKVAPAGDYREVRAWQQPVQRAAGHVRHLPCGAHGYVGVASERVRTLHKQTPPHVHVPLTSGYV